MAHAHNDPFEELIADGRVHIRPVEPYGLPEIITIDLELMANTLVNRLSNVYLYDTNIYNYYVGSTQDTTQAMVNDIKAMVDFAIGQTYNKLRTVLERKHPMMRTTRMNPKCPVPGSLEFPAWLSSTLSCIGPCHVIDSLRNTLLIYASTAATMNNYGRANPVVFNEGNYHRLMTALRRCNIAMALFDNHGMTGSYYPTIDPIVEANTWTTYGQVHHSYYKNEDLARIALVTNDLGITPFEDVGVIFDYVDNEAALNALAAVAAPANIPAGQTATSAGRPVEGYFCVNYYGIQPAVAAQGNIPAQPRGMYVLGRGINRYYQCVLAKGITAIEVHEILRNRLMRQA